MARPVSALAASLSLSVALLACGGEASSDASPADAAPDAPSDSGPADAPSDSGPAECERACTATAPWRCDACVTRTLQEISAAVVGGRIYVAGGFETPLAIVPTVRVYDPAADAWAEVAPLPAARHHIGFVALGTTLYALGGSLDLGFEPLSRCWSLDTADADASWVEIAPLPRPRSSMAAGVIGGRVVVAAGQADGRSDDERLDNAAETLLYDPATDEWTAAAAIPTVREHVAGVVVGGELVVLGGRRFGLEPTLDVVEAYDPEADAWRTLPPMTRGHGGFAAAVVGDTIYAAGGEQRGEALDVIEALELDVDTEWSLLAPLPTPRHGHAMASVAGRVYVIGGADMPIFAAVDVVESFAP